MIAIGVIVFCAAASAVTGQGLEKNGDVPDQLADGRLITSPSEFVTILSQLKLIAGFVSNASLTAPSTGFKYVQCPSSYGTWILQIQAESERALSKSTMGRARIRNELEAVKMALYGVLGVREAEKRMQDKERRRSVARYQQEIVDNLRKAASAANESVSNLKSPKLMMEEMESALPLDEANSMDDEYCKKEANGPMSARHKRKAIALLREAVEHWNELIDLHKYIHQRVSRDLDQGERPLLQYRIEAFIRDERQTAQEFQAIIAPIVQRMVRGITIVKAVEESYLSQNIAQRITKMPIISGRRNDTSICREYSRLASEAMTYDQKARDTLLKALKQQ